MHKYQIISSSTPSYYPGIKALWNSIKINAPNCTLSVYCYDNTEEYKDLENLGIKVILNKKLLGPIVQKGRVRPNGGPVNEDMYARLMVSQDFTGRVFYVDADCIILKPIYELWDDLNMEGFPTACVYREDIGWRGGNIHDKMASGTYLADTDKWRELKIAEKCFQVMEDNLNGKTRVTFGLNVESVLSYIHGGNFLHLDRAYQNLTYYGKLSKEDRVAHFADFKPWSGRKVNYRKLWDAYYHNDIETINNIESQLPDKKWQKIHPTQRTAFRAKQDQWSY